VKAPPNCSRIAAGIRISAKLFSLSLFRFLLPGIEETFELGGGGFFKRFLPDLDAVSREKAASPWLT
jgi:hypothetical protein